jgi:hypothetical protein
MRGLANNASFAFLASDRPSRFRHAAAEDGPSPCAALGLPGPWGGLRGKEAVCNAVGCPWTRGDPLVVNTARRRRWHLLA